MGEGYYAETTCKQTVEILKRRGKGLESQVDSLKAMVKDLEAEASFFDNTASEAAVSSGNPLIWCSIESIILFVVSNVLPQLHFATLIKTANIMQRPLLKQSILFSICSSLCLYNEAKKERRVLS